MGVIFAFPNHQELPRSTQLSKLAENRLSVTLAYGPHTLCPISKWVKRFLLCLLLLQVLLHSHKLNHLAQESGEWDGIPYHQKVCKTSTKHLSLFFVLCHYVDFSIEHWPYILLSLSTHCLLHSLLSTSELWLSQLHSCILYSMPNSMPAHCCNIYMFVKKNCVFVASAESFDNTNNAETLKNDTCKQRNWQFCSITWWYNRSHFVYLLWCWLTVC